MARSVAKPLCEKEVARELSMRRLVYPKQIRDGRLAKQRANRQYLAIETLQLLLEGLTVKEFDDIIRRAKEARQHKVDQGKLFT
ncbi:hypothetical protein [Lewinella sp. JB7]|uniref:hypothetical protein n=1 Tax=Lewinella sp. JB7 TaxID=2962887 RepID=UPI0020C9B69E|nr:hypothetical protein [Lewinella sp. JB7]MCP9237178.1 hypothetical protein [Lewinella sp. JB7]